MKLNEAEVQTILSDLQDGRSSAGDDDVVALCETALAWKASADAERADRLKWQRRVEGMMTKVAVTRASRDKMKSKVSGLRATIGSGRGAMKRERRKRNAAEKTAMKMKAERDDLAVALQDRMAVEREVE